MAKRKGPKKAHNPPVSPSSMSSAAHSNAVTHRRNGDISTLPPVPGAQTSLGTRRINLAPPENGEVDTFFDEPEPWTFGRIVGRGAALVHMSLLPVLGLGVSMSLIFGGCCSNVRIQMAGKVINTHQASL